jgi:hypothetical protein
MMRGEGRARGRVKREEATWEMEVEGKGSEISVGERREGAAWEIEVEGERKISEEPIELNHVCWNKFWVHCPDHASCC